MSRKNKETAEVEPAAEVKPVNALNLTPYNPRRPWNEEQRQRFAKSLREFGDLSGVVFNRRTGHLVGGNKRCERFSEIGGEVHVEFRYEKPDPTGTVALGYVIVEGARFAYREVDWPETKERAANLAANRWHAEWDEDQLAEVLRSLEGTPEIELTGFAHEELLQVEPDAFDATESPDAVRRNETPDSNLSYIIYLTFKQKKDFLRALELLSGGTRRSLPEDARFAHI